MAGRSLRANPVRWTLAPAVAVAALCALLVETKTGLSSTHGWSVGWFLGINAAGYLVWAVDKRQARREGFRVPEWTLHLLALLGGGVGGVLAMRTLRHKTRKRLFRWTQPLLAVLAVCGLVWVLSR